MKPTMALKPLVFALAAVMAVAVQAGDGGKDNKDKHRWDKKHHSPLWGLLISAGATANVNDYQSSSGNWVLNEATQNEAEMSYSAGGANGNLGANVAAGSGNQQDNVAAIATADEHFVFGTSYASAHSNQYSDYNHVDNHSSSNTATLAGSGGGSSGNIGINVAAGDFNQQKNNLAIAVSGGRVANAYAGASQTSSGNTVNNYADRTYKTDTLYGTFYARGHYEGYGVGYVEDDDYKKGGKKGYNDHKVDKDKLKFREEGTISLAGHFSYQVRTPHGWANPVTNTATMTGSLNHVSGNVGANVAAGSGNQQANSLSIAAGCRTCM
ncbi:heme utilization protein [Pseudomonas sp. R5(2019)]|uniref:heme utilization protein n=1 Tax=Pseudomonas sp. R5(2019) TaxID=2697566 RepID=UPI0014131A00|nr:heme utilization protein [Pseudomonas sp. R5(2019)]NBA98165.1 heme utilization protein [Pseudomonas sp. R5(2019)]